MFTSLFGKPNPTRQWQPQGGQSLTFNLDSGSLNDGELGQRLECLSFLGPDEDRKSFRNGEFRYYSLGLCVECRGAEFEFNDTSSLKRLIVTNRPLLADEAQRKAYHVTKPWPVSD